MSLCLGSVGWLVDVIISHQKDTYEVCEWSIKHPSRRFMMQCSPKKNGCAPSGLLGNFTGLVRYRYLSCFHTIDP